MRDFFIPFLFGIALCGQGFGNPENPQIIAGEAAFETNGMQLSIQASDRTIINWESFSISKGEITSFQLPDSQACILNRVVGANPTEIYGMLQSNGNLYLINSNGILVGKEGIIQTGSLCASTLNLSDDDFLQGKSLLFTDQASQALTHCGKIVAMSGDVVLLSVEIKNEGCIEALQGAIGMGAGKEIRLLPDGDERIQVRLQAAPELQPTATGIYQAGHLHAQKAELKADGNLYAYAIKNDGYIKATKVERCGGSVTLVAEQGHVNHCGKIEGENVKLLGKYVTLVGDATIDVSQVNGGGSVLIGGDYQGSNPEIINATGTLVEQGVVISADALEEGNGGKVIVWADEITGFYGKVFARGGTVQGDGGFVEVSGKEVLDFAGLVNTLASNGKVGTLLLDPTDITISTAATDAGIVFGGACGALTYCNTGVTSPRNINNAAILANLALGNVTINSTPGGPAGGNGDITFSAGSPFTWTGVNTNTFTLNARRNITFSADFTNSTSGGNFVANAGLGVLGTITIGAGVTVSHSSAGTITFNSNTTAGSDVTISGILSVTGGNLSIILLDDFTLAATPAALTFNSPGNTFTFTTTAAAGSIATFTGPVTVNGIANWTTSGTLIFGNITTSGTNTFTINSVGTVTQTAATTFQHDSSGTLSVSATGAGSDVVLNGITNVTASNLTISLDDDFTLAVSPAAINFISPGNTFSFTTTAAAGSVANFNGGVTVNGIINWNTSGTLNINDGFTTSGTGTVTMTSVGSISSSAAPLSNISHGSSGDFIMTTTGAGSDITIGGIFTATSSNVTFHPTDDFTLTASTGNLTFSAAGKILDFQAGGTTNQNFNGIMSVTGGTLIVTADDDIVVGVNGSITYNVPGGSATFTSTGGGDPDFTLNGMLTMTNGTLSITAFDDIVVAATGIFNFNSPNSGTLLANGTDGDITMSGIMSVTNGTISMTAVDDITFGAGGTFTYSAPGPLTIMTTGGAIANNIVMNGTMTISNGVVTMTASGAVTFATGVIPVTYTSPFPWTITANLGAITFSSPVNLTTAAPFTISSLADGIVVNSLVRNFSSGNMTATAALDFTVGTVAITLPSQFGTAGGMTTIVAGDDVMVTSSENTAGATATIGFSFGGQQGDVSITATNDVIVDAEGNQDASIISTRTVTINAGGDVSLRTEESVGNVGEAFIQSNGNLSIAALDVALIGIIGGADARIESFAGDMLIVAQKNMTLYFNAVIRNSGPGKLTLVVDQQAPFPPQIGDGQFIFVDAAEISTAGGELGIFTATPGQNTFLGLVNGATLDEGNQVFGVWYSTFSGSSEPPFTIYYKLGGPTPPIIITNIAASEMIQEYFDRMMGWAWITSFWVCTPRGCNGYSIYYRKPFEHVIYLPWFQYYPEMAWRDASTRVSL